jgi:hypothetical protein
MLAIASIWAYTRLMATEEDAFLKEALERSSVQFIGPFQHHEVVVNGWQVPYLTAVPIPGGRVHITLDNRIGVELTVDEAERVVPFLADAIAVAAGYTGHPDGGEPVQRLPFVQMKPLDLG